MGADSPVSARESSSLRSSTTSLSGAEVSASSATTPSLNGSLEILPSPKHGYPSLSRDALGFLSDLNNYLPLGCLCFEDVVQADTDRDTAVWKDLSSFTALPAFEEPLYSHLHKLISAGWIRVSSCRSLPGQRYIIFRVYILPFDVGLRYIDRQSKRLYAALEQLITGVDVSPETWKGQYKPGRSQKFDIWATQDEGSLFWMFNNIPSPSPDASDIDERYTCEAMEDLLDRHSQLPGLKTQLYPYQRRSAGLMLQRESVSSRELDPRLERRVAPDGSEYFYGPRDLSFLRHPRYYESCSGGVLAETMGLGKTVICLALILATKDHLPKVPAEYSLPRSRPTTASLSEMVISNINRKSVPWKVEFQRVKQATGNDLENVRSKLEEALPAYKVPLPPTRWNRKTIEPPPKTITLASTTIIVVPRNLCRQWQSEIQKHVDADLFKILVMDNAKSALPKAEELRDYDIVLFTRSRFEAEIQDGADEQGRRIGSTQRDCRCPYIGATRTRDCTCLRTDDLYDSPLKHLHFKRLIIDEGHFFSNTNTTAVAVANKLITADSRWVVSGTPAKDLLGVEVDLSSSENLWHTPNTKKSRDALLEQRRHFSKKDDTNGAIRSIGALATNFLKIKPWAASDSTEKGLQWDEYIYRHEGLRRRTFSGFSPCLRRVLNAMVVKTQPEDVERDISLPPLSHEVVRLQPSFYDKLTANLFTLVLTANAVTSERTDVDYLFHKNSQKARSQLIANLRQSAFFWTGFSEADVLASVKSSNAYLAKEGTNCSEEDRTLLRETLSVADTILASEGWKALSRSHEIGLFVEDWPAESAELWTFDGSLNPLFTGISQLLEAQKHVNERAGTDDPGEGLAGIGIKAVAPAKHGSVKQESMDEEEKPVLTKSGIPTSSINGEPDYRRRGLLTKGQKASPKKITKAFKVAKPNKKMSAKVNRRMADAIRNEFMALDRITSPAPSTPSIQDIAEPELQLPSALPVRKTRIIGTSSAKLSYLASQVLKYYKDEKILIFYDGDNAAYYIAQMLELLHIKHEIYAKTLAAHLKAEYVVRFDQEAQDRVLLMDVRNAAYGLNLPSASRIYFVNPTCRPNVEAQAIKRAHRIGQTRPVYVETLVLEGTIEEKMLERSKRMTRSEHRDAGHLEDDVRIREIIQSAKALPVAEEEKSGYGQMAPLQEPQQLWCREGYASFLGKPGGSPAAGNRKRKRQEEAEGHVVTTPSNLDPNSGRPIVRRTLAFVDCSGGSSGSRFTTTHERSEDDRRIFNSSKIDTASDVFLATRRAPSFSPMPTGQSKAFETPVPVRPRTTTASQQDRQATTVWEVAYRGTAER